MKIYLHPNPTATLSLIVLLVLIALKLGGLLDTWVAVVLYIAYVAVIVILICIDPKFEEKVRKFGQQIERGREKKEKEKVFNSLMNSVEFRRKQVRVCRKKEG